MHNSLKERLDLLRQDALAVFANLKPGDLVPPVPLNALDTAVAVATHGNVVIRTDNGFFAPSRAEVPFAALPIEKQVAIVAMQKQIEQ